MSETRELDVDIGGRVFRITSNDAYLDQHRGGFEPATVKLLRALGEGVDTALDVGANIGCTALLLGGMARRVVAFEPSALTYSFLDANVRRSGLTNVLPVQVGLGAEDGAFELTVAPSNRSGGYVSNLTQAGAGHEIERIAIRTMDGVAHALNLQGIGFVKVDVEGFEGQVLKGGARTLAQHRPTCALELNHWCLNAFQRTSVPDFFDQLRAIFPVLLAVDDGCYLDVHDEHERYVVMYEHILRFRFGNLVGAFDEGRVATLRAQYRHGS